MYISIIISFGSGALTAPLAVYQCQRAAPDRGGERLKVWAPFVGRNRWRAGGPLSRESSINGALEASGSFGMMAKGRGANTLALSRVVLRAQCLPLGRLPCTTSTTSTSTTSTISATTSTTDTSTTFCVPSHSRPQSARRPPVATGHCHRSTANRFETGAQLVALHLPAKAGR